MDDGNPRQFDIVLFDLDGVITSEYAYWKAAALTVYEYFYEDLELNSEYCYDNADSILDTVFSYQNTIAAVKSLGVNSNWDLAYLTILSIEILKSDGVEEEDIFDKIPDFLLEKNLLAPDLLESLAEEHEEIFNYPEGYSQKGGDFYQEIVDKFQQWYLGDNEYLKAYGHPAEPAKGNCGLIHSEEPLLSQEETKSVLHYLKEQDYQLGIGTGRPNQEALKPLERWGLLGYFESERFVGHDEIVSWQSRYQEMFQTKDKLVKPHPFQFIKAAVGSDFTLNHLAKHKDFSRVLVVGDALCDLLAAHAAGCKFCAVLTGVDGKEARTFFENMEADYILDDITELPQIL